jgi:hypothetical protein
MVRRLLTITIIKNLGRGFAMEQIPIKTIDLRSSVRFCFDIHKLHRCCRQVHLSDLELDEGRHEASRLPRSARRTLVARLAASQRRLDPEGYFWAHLRCLSVVQEF